VIYPVAFPLHKIYRYYIVVIYPVAFPLHKICGNNIEMPAAALFPAIVLPLSSGNYFKVGNSLSIIAQRQF